MRIGKLFPFLFPLFLSPLLTECANGYVFSIQFNVVSKGLGSERMSFYLNEAAGDMRDLLIPTLEAPKAKL